MTKRLATLAVLALAAACASTPARPVGQGGANEMASNAPPVKWAATEGTYAVGVIPAATVRDTQRSRDVVMNIEYPTRGGPYPVIIFSHGFGATKESYTALSAYWAGRGYVCIKPAHADAGAIRGFAPERRDSPGGAASSRSQDRGRRDGDRRNNPADAKTPPMPPAGEFLWKEQTPADWQNRARDISFVIDSLGRLQEQYPELAGIVDTARIGVAGESYGAFTTLLATGAVNYRTNPPLQLGDKRIRAAIVMSPQGAGEQFGFTPASFANLGIPMMFMTGSMDRAPVGDGDPAWRHEAFAASPAGDKYFVSFEGARHATFGGPLGLTEQEMTRPETVMVPTTDAYGRTVMVEQERQDPRRRVNSVERERRIFASIRLATSAFWDAYLKSDVDARDYLTAPNGLQGQGSTKVTVERK